MTQPTDRWSRPARCGDNNCPEVYISSRHDGVMLRSSRHPEAVAMFTLDEWRTLVAAIRDGGYGPS